MATSNAESTRFLVIVMLGDSSDQQRLRTLVPALQGALTKASTDRIEQAFRSPHADSFGYFIRSSLRATQIRARLETPDPPPFLDNSDSVLILEIGADFRGFGRSRAWTWLQRH